MVFVSGCSAAGMSRPGTIVPVEEPVREARDRAIIEFNKATALLVRALDAQTGEFDVGKIEEAIAAYKEAERLFPGDAETKKQLGIIYEFFKNDEKASYEYYKRYIELGGTDPEIIAVARELSGKYDSPASKEEDLP